MLSIDLKSSNMILLFFPYCKQSNSFSNAKPLGDFIFLILLPFIDNNNL